MSNITKTIEDTRYVSEFVQHDRNYKTGRRVKTYGVWDCKHIEYLGLGTKADMGRVAKILNK